MQNKYRKPIRRTLLSNNLASNYTDAFIKINCSVVRTFLRCSETVISRDVLNVVDERCVGQQFLVLVQPVDRVLERQLCAAVFLVLREYGT